MVGSGALCRSRLAGDYDSFLNHIRNAIQKKTCTPYTCKYGVSIHKKTHVIINHLTNHHQYLKTPNNHHAYMKYRVLNVLII